MARPRRRCRDLAPDRDALAWRQRGCEFDPGHQQVEGPLGVGLDELQLRERGRESFDVVAVLHFIEPVVWHALCGMANRRVASRRSASATLRA